MGTYASSAADDPADRRSEWGCVGRAAAFDGVIDHHHSVVVDDLALVAELDQAAQAALGDRAGVATGSRCSPCAAAAATSCWTACGPAEAALPGA
jgi:hypothetical protein